MSPSFVMMTFKTIQFAMFTDTRHYMFLLTKAEPILEESHHDYKLFQFMCKLEINQIYEALEGQRNDTYIDSNAHPVYIHLLSRRIYFNMLFPLCRRKELSMLHRYY
ncbi:hypothetical protein KQ3_04828 [Bacillus cereus B5-2]|nr:hypothetical protein KQ3_04828 [Bacillus cereus B5-2]